ncbi:PAAR domain-containing protein [Vibrio sp. AK197]
MRAISRLGDGGTGHGAFVPRASNQGSDNVFCNGLPVHRQSDSWAVHCDPSLSCHTGVLLQGAQSIFVNGLPIGRVGDPIECGSLVAAGSPSVFAGD